MTDLSDSKCAAVVLAIAAVGAVIAVPPLTAQQEGPVAPVAVVTGSLNEAPRPHAQAVRATGSIQIDGLLDEASWDEAFVIDRFVQLRPSPGAPVSERTEVRLLYDDENFYVGAELYDSNPSGIVRSPLQRDNSTAQGATFAIALDTFLDGRNGVVFFFNAGGVIRDAQTAEDGRVRNVAWNSAANVKTRVHDRGWTVELLIPWTSLRFDGSREEQVWGMNLFRRIRRKNEEAMWAPVDRGWTVYNVSRSGTLGGLDGIQPGRNLSVKPYVISSRATGFLRPKTESNFDGGADIKYGITSGMTLDLSLNTDFSQVEADRPQVNLTRFSLFFPERREFFLENASLFEFGDQSARGQRGGGSSRDLTLFHSRRIGLSPTRAPLPILGGGRISGTAGPLRIGLLNMQTSRDSAVAAENFSVARVRGDLHPNLTAGAIVVNRTSTTGVKADNRSYGIDADFTALNDYLLVQSYLAATEGTESDGTSVDRAYAGRLSVSWDDPLWDIGAMYRQIDEDFTPGVGFVRRRGIRHVYSTVGISPQVFWGVVEELNPSIVTHHFTALGGELETREIGGGMQVGFRDGSRASFNFTDRFERIHEPFSVGGATVPAGEHDFREGSVSYGSSGGRALSGQVNVGGGGFYSGNRFTIGGSVLGRLGGDRATVGISAEHNRIDLPGQQAVDAAVYSAGFQYFFSTSLLTTGLIQYDETAQELLTDLRLNWVHAPLSDLYLVLTERRDTKAQQVLERLLTLKVTRLFQF
jgi:hypothetical protein